MKTSFIKSALMVPVAALSLTGIVMAQDADTTPAKPMYLRPQSIPDPDAVQPAVTLPTWNGSFTYSGHTYTYNMVGAAPSSNATTTIPVYIIPLKIVITSGSTTTTYDAEHVLTNGRTVIQNVVDSPIFDSTTKYDQGGTVVGTTQYIDAFQRANFWGTVSTIPNYHLLLERTDSAGGADAEPLARDGKQGKPFGLREQRSTISWIDSAEPAASSRSSKINPAIADLYRCMTPT